MHKRFLAENKKERLFNAFNGKFDLSIQTFYVVFEHDLYINHYKLKELQTCTEFFTNSILFMICPSLRWYLNIGRSYQPEKIFFPGTPFDLACKAKPSKEDAASEHKLSLFFKDKINIFQVDSIILRNRD